MVDRVLFLFCFYLYVSLLVYEQVLGLQVSVDQVQSVQVLEGQDYLGSIKPGVRLTARKEETGQVSRTSDKAEWAKGR